MMGIITGEASDLAYLIDDILVAARSEISQISVEGDGARIRQILRNLIGSARRHGGGQVQIVIQTDGPHARPEVRDDGPPIPIEIEERLFQRYQRSGEPSDITETLGLGLSVSSDLAQMMGGTLRYGRHDGWTVFSLLLPLAAGARNPGPSVDALH